MLYTPKPSFLEHCNNAQKIEPGEGCVDVRDVFNIAQKSRVTVMGHFGMDGYNRCPKARIGSKTPKYRQGYKRRKTRK